jgi:trk system potassium uptake protein TrkA
VVDRNAARCQEIAKRHSNVRVLCGDITDEALMNEEDLYSCDLIVAASGNYELNLVTAAYMKSKGANKAVALTASTAYGAVARKLGIDVAVPMRGTVVDSILSHLRGRNVSAIHSVGNRSFEIVEGDISDKSRFAGKKLRDLADLDGEFLLLLATDSNGVTAIPNGDSALEAGSHVVLIVKSGDTKLLAQICGK